MVPPRHLASASPRPPFLTLLLDGPLFSRATGMRVFSFGWSQPSLTTPPVCTSSCSRPAIMRQPASFSRAFFRVFSPIGSFDCHCCACACQLRLRSLEATRDVPCSLLPTFDAYPAGFPIFPFLSVSWLPLFWSWMARRLDQTIARSCELCNGSVASPLSSPSSHACASPLFDSLC